MRVLLFLWFCYIKRLRYVLNRGEKTKVLITWFKILQISVIRCYIIGNSSVITKVEVQRVGETYTNSKKTETQEVPWLGILDVSSHSGSRRL